MKHIHFVRHGENPANLTREFSYKLIDYSLTPIGILQAQQTAEYFADKGIDAVFTSPLKRAAETAQIIASRIHAPVYCLEDFREINVGDLEIPPVTAEKWAINHQVFQSWLRGERSACYPNGEDHFTLTERFMRGMKTVFQHQHGGQNYIIVAHGGILGASISTLCPQVSRETMLTLHHNCSISEVLVEGNNGTLRGEILTWAQMNHLSGAAITHNSGLPEKDEMLK